MMDQEMITREEHERLMKELADSNEKRIDQLMSELAGAKAMLAEKDRIISNLNEILSVNRKAIFGPDSESTAALYGSASVSDADSEEDMPASVSDAGNEEDASASDMDDVLADDVSGPCDPPADEEPAVPEVSDSLPGEAQPGNGPDGAPEDDAGPEGSEDKGGDSLDDREPAPPSNGKGRKDRSSLEELAKDLPKESRFTRCDPADLPDPGVPGRWVHSGWKEDGSFIAKTPAEYKLVRNFKEVLEFVPDDALPEEYGDRTLRAEAVSPLKLIPGGSYSPEQAASDVFDRFMMHIPYYRTENAGKTFGFAVPRSTEAFRLCECVSRYLMPVYNTMHKVMILRDIIHADETTAQVLHEPGRKASLKSYMFLYVTGDDGKPMICMFDYAPGRGEKYPRAFLKGFKGILFTDSYAGYNSADKSMRVKCYAHLRRKFFDAIPREAVKHAGPRMITDAETGFFFCNQMFYMERFFADMDADERKNAREVWLRPLLDDFYRWLESLSPAGGSGLEKAVGYALNNREEFYNVLLDGRLVLSNNCAERLARFYSLSRKSSLFHCSVAGAEASAVYQSLIMTAQANGINVYLYLYALFCFMPAKADDEEFIMNEMMPWSERMVRLCSGRASRDAMEQIWEEASPLLIEAHRKIIAAKREYREMKEMADCMEAHGYAVEVKKPEIMRYTKEWAVEEETADEETVTAGAPVILRVSDADASKALNSLLERRKDLLKTYASGVSSDQLEKQIKLEFTKAAQAALKGTLESAVI